MSGVVLGIDLATASARCVAVDASDGTIVASAATDLSPPVRDGSCSSRQRADYAEAALAVLGLVCTQLAARAQDVAAVSVTGTSGTVVPCDRDGRPLGDARLYDDSTGSGLAGAQGAAMLGRVASLASEHPDARYASTADVVAGTLVGQRVQGDTSHWLKAGIDPVARSWPDRAVHDLGLDRAALPDLVHPGTVLGTVSDGLAAGLGLPRGVLVVAGMTDGCTAQIATGAVHEGDTVGVLGTTLVLKAVHAEQVESRDGAVYSHLAPDARWWAGGASNTGAGVLNARFPTADLAAMDAAVAGSVSTIVGYPLTGAGERFPVADRSLHSLASGPAAGEPDAYRAVLEGVAFVERLGLERLVALGVTPGRHVLAGGASNSTVWNRIRATVLGSIVPISRTARAGSAVGAAVLAASALDDGAFAETVDRLIPSPSPIEPVATQRDPLEDAYQRFLELVAGATSHAGPEGAKPHA